MDRSEVTTRGGNSKLVNEGSSQAPSQPQVAIPDGFVNRKTLREMANATEHDLKSLEGDKLLRAAKRGAGGWRLYTLDQVERVREQVATRRQLREAKTNEGPAKHLPAFRDHAVAYSLEEYALVLDAITRSVTRERIPIETNVHPAIVKNILKDHSEMTGAILIAKPTVDAINALAIPGVGTIRNADDLLEALKAVGEDALEVKTCVGCKTESRTHCMTCVQKLIARQLKKQQKNDSPAKTPPMDPDGTVAIPTVQPPQTVR